MTTASESVLSKSLLAALAGHRELALDLSRHAAADNPQDPLLWLCLAWLADSPDGMATCLQHLRKHPHYGRMAEHGVAFANEFAQLCRGSQSEPVQSEAALATPAGIEPVVPESPAIAPPRAQARPVEPVRTADRLGSDTWFTGSTRNEETDPQADEALDIPPVTTAPRAAAEIEETIVSAERAVLAAESDDSPETEVVSEADVKTSGSEILDVAPEETGDSSGGRFTASSGRSADKEPGGASLFGSPASLLDSEEEELQDVLNSAALADQATSEDTNPDGAPTVLIVDDSPTVRKLVQINLESEGYHVVTAADGVSAIKQIAQYEPRLILLDINMPQLDGYQLCNLIRKHERTRDIPVVMLSGKDGVFDRLRGRMVGCTSYITKPFAPDALVAEVARHMPEVFPPRAQSDSTATE